MRSFRDLIETLGKKPQMDFRRWHEYFSRMVDERIRDNGLVFLLLILLQVATYSYFYTTLIFTNHTFPNTWLQSYPSHRTLFEGRWVADLIVAAQGGSGVQSFQMIIATMLQALNGILLARFAGLNGKRAIFCIAAVLCMYPAFLDYYSFSIDHVTFVLGDTLALTGAFCFLKCRKVWTRIGGSALFFLMSIAAYQPKVSLVSFLACSALLLRLLKTAEPKPANFSMRDAIFDALSLVVAVVVSLGLYWLTSKIVVTADASTRLHLNTLGDIIREMFSAYPKTFIYFTSVSTGIPSSLRLLSAFGIVLGVAAVLLQAWRKHALAVLLAIGVLALMPIALRATYVINNLSWPDAGRLLVANGYCLAFFLGLGFRTKIIRAGSSVAAIICLYFFTVLATQQSSAAMLKTTYDLNFINRIVARSESVLGRLGGPPRPVVVAGSYPDFNQLRHVRYSNGQSTACVSSHAFPGYRQSESLNFFLGQDILRHPTADEVSRALESMSHKEPWPSEESVYLLDGEILVILLEPYRLGIPTTWTD